MFDVEKESFKGGVDFQRCCCYEKQFPVLHVFLSYLSYIVKYNFVILLNITGFVLCQQQVLCFVCHTDFIRFYSVKFFVLKSMYVLFYGTSVRNLP